MNKQSSLAIKLDRWQKKKKRGNTYFECNSCCLDNEVINRNFNLF